MRKILLHGLTALAFVMSTVALTGCDAPEEAAVEDEEQANEVEDD